MREIEIGKTYRHFKGHIYKVVSIGHDSETYNEADPDKSRLVVYENIDSKEVWIRPYDMFNSLVDKEKYPEVEQKYRFEEILDEY